MPIVQIRKFLVQKCHLQPDGPLVAGVSGGPDSLVLLDALHRAGMLVVVAHFDHQLRPDSGADAEKVAKAAGERGLAYEVGRADVRTFAAKEGLSIEEAARKARYRFLFRVARERGAQGVVTAHTADDQAETVLMHFLRGSGLAGLKGMTACSILPEWDEHIPLVRPFLDVWRKEIEAYCLEHELQPVIDQTNQDTTYFRNRLRHELLPVLGSYNPQIRQALVHTAGALQEDYEVLRGLSEKAWEVCIWQAGEGYVAIDLPRFLEQPLGLQRAILRQAAGHLKPDHRDFDYAVLERATQFARGKDEGEQVDLAAGLRLVREGDRLYLADWKAGLPWGGWPIMDCDQMIQLIAGHKVKLKEGWQVLVAEREIRPGQWPFKDNEANQFEAWLDLDKLSDPLTLRCRRAGERYQPLGMGGHSVKLSDLFINGKVPRRARESWPLLFCGKILAWVPGFQPAETFRLRETSRKALHIQFIREG